MQKTVPIDFSRFSDCEVFKHPDIHKHYCSQRRIKNKPVWGHALGSYNNNDNNNTYSY